MTSPFKKNQRKRYISFTQRVRDKFIDWSIPIVFTAVVSAIGSFIAFTKLSANAVVVTYANAERLTTLESKLETDYLSRAEADVRTANRDRELQELQRHLDQRFDEINKRANESHELLVKIIDKL